MSNQPYGYEGHQGHPGYDAHQQPEQQQPYAAQPQWQGHDEGQAAHAQQYTQQWEGQTWETQVQPQTAPFAPNLTETAYLPPQTDGRPAPSQYAPDHQPGPHGRTGPQGQPGPMGQAYPQGQGFAQGQAPVAPHDHAQGGDSGGSGEGGPAYGPPTLTGNARITDAQRARAEGRSPIIEPGMQPALITAVLGLLLAGAATIGEYVLAVPLVILQAVTAAGWFRLNGMWPARQGIVLAFAGALAADAALFAAGREHAPAAILGTLGVWVLLGIVLGLRSHADPDERMYGLMATIASAALAIIATGYLAAAADAVTVGGVAVAVAVVARALPLPTAASVVVALLAAAGAGVAVGGGTDLGGSGALLGAGAGLCALVGHRVASYDYPSRFVHFTAGVALPLAAAAPAVYLLGRALG
ncbi:hypothetical protein [Streptomyces sp. MA5143a]|uniref:hypothetical protein n=1 Tax=Streptomyces sp. MA5143a TaxID=2083010 RepID=UPI000D1A59D0|nr:hypothetical protein [Streptomyces sp. MA5143a]SPF05358.1 hypothetical protein SMA5143A_6169 [Streptomyces sp. MA5143a]